MGSDKVLSIKSNIIWSSVGSIIGLSCQWLIGVLVVRLSSGFSDAGLYSLAMSVYGIFFPIAQYRMYTYQVSDVNGENTVGEYLSFRLLTILFSLVLTVAYSLFTCRLASVICVFLYGLYKSANQLIDVLHAADQQFFRMDYVGVSLALQGALSLVFFCVALSCFRSVPLAIFAMFIAVALVGWFYDLPRTSALTSIAVGISRNKVKLLLITCLPAVVAGIAVSASSSIPRQYLSSALGDSALGVYSSIAAPIAIIQMGVSYLYNPLLGYFSKSYSDRDSSSFFRLCFACLFGALIIAVVFGIGFEVFGNSFFLFVFGEEILPFMYLVPPMIASAVLTGLMWLVNDLLISFRYFSHTLVAGVLMFIVSLSSMEYSVRVFNINGVTVCSLISCLFGLVYMVVVLSILLRRHFSNLV